MKNTSHSELEHDIRKVKLAVELGKDPKKTRGGAPDSGEREMAKDPTTAAFALSEPYLEALH